MGATLRPTRALVNGPALVLISAVLQPPVASVTLHAGQALLPAGWVRDLRLTVRGGVIGALAADMAPEPGDERHAVLIPGLGNLHSHGFQRGLAGRAETSGVGHDSFWTWRETMYRFVAELTPDRIQAITALAYMEMLESGFTRVGEFHYLHHDRAGRPYADPAETAQAIVAAAVETGIGLTLLPAFYAHSGFGGAAPHPQQARFLHGLDSFAALLERTRLAVRALPDGVVGVAPHSLRAVTGDQLAALEQLAGAGPIHLHVAEQQQEVADCLVWSGARPVAWLLDHAPVDARWCLIHATHMSASEAAALARTGAVVGLCPITEANLGDGIFPAGPYRAAGGRFGVGTDSNVLIDLTEELRLLEYGQRLSQRARTVFAGGPGLSTGGALFAAACAGASQALHGARGIAVGEAADLVSLDVAHPSIGAALGDGLLDGLIFAAGRSAIDCVWRRGCKLVSGGRHQGRNAILGKAMGGIPGAAGRLGAGSSASDDR